MITGNLAGVPLDVHRSALEMIIITRGANVLQLNLVHYFNLNLVY